MILSRNFHKDMQEQSSTTRRKHRSLSCYHQFIPQTQRNALDYIKKEQKKVSFARFVLTYVKIKWNNSNLKLLTSFSLLNKEIQGHSATQKCMVRHHRKLQYTLLHQSTPKPYNLRMAQSLRVNCLLHENQFKP